MKPLPVFLFLVLGLSCCASKKKSPEPTGKASLIGMIEMVNPEQNYVLIRCEPMPSITTGTELIALGADGSRAKLTLTPERKGHYLTADIKEGQPAVSNLVLLQRSAPTSFTETTPVPTPAPTPAPSTYQPFPSLPGISNGGVNGIPALPLEPALPVQSQTIAVPAEPPATGFGDLEPAVGGQP